MPGVTRMARPIKRLPAKPNVMTELRRRSRSTTIGVRDRERANIILLRIQGLGVEAVAERLSTTTGPWSLGLESGARHHRGDASAVWQKPLEYSFDGAVRWRFGEFGAAHLVRQ